LRGKGAWTNSSYQTGRNEAEDRTSKQKNAYSCKVIFIATTRCVIENKQFKQSG